MAEHARQADDEAGGQLAAAGADQRDGARARVGRRRAHDIALRDASRQRDGKRVQDRGAPRRQLVELGAPQPQHQAVAQRRHRGRAHAAGEEGDLAHRLAGTQLGNGLAPAGDGDEEAPGDHHIECVRRLALAHQHVAALEVERLELGGEAGTLRVLEIAKDLDAVEAVLGNFGLHLCSWLLGRFRKRPYPSLLALRTLRRRAGLRGMVHRLRAHIQGAGGSRAARWGPRL